MPVSTEDDWSDSDEEIGAGTETDVLLGVPDGRVETDSDVRDAAVSRIGGLPAFLPSREPPFSSSQCKVCSDPMELLVQVWCPFEDSPMDRALYVWGCAHTTCQRQDGSVRAWRGLRHNAHYAAKLAKKKMQNTAPQKNITATNPFSMKPTAQSMSFGLGDQIFGNQAIDKPEQVHDDDSDADDDRSSLEDSLVTAMASASVADSFWAAAPSYPPIYLSTISEYIPNEPKRVPANVVGDDAEAGGKSGKDKNSTWMETYENSLKTDSVFDRFTKRVGYTGEQCLRYELEGTPLPFASDKVFEQLFPAAAQTLVPVTRGEFSVDQATKRSYSTGSIPPCPCCKSGRVFECQLMPNLINVLGESESDGRKWTDEQRIKAVQDALRRSNERGMEWGTCMVFSCRDDCAEECWREEYVLVQWDEC